MGTKIPKVAVIYLSFHCEPYIDDVVSSFRRSTYSKDKTEFVIVDNPHPQYGSSVRYLSDNVLPLSGNELPHVTVLAQNKNLGFAGGNNAGIKWALDNGFDYVYLHNNDGFMASDCLEKAVDAMENDKQIGIAQSFILLYPETDLINSSGNSFQFLGMGYCNNFRKPRGSVVMPQVAETAYASGAALLLRADLLKQFESWDEDYYLYHEDIEYSFRLRAAGYKIVVARDSVFYHKYSFSRNREKFYYIERNRFGLMITFFKLRTLLLFLPIGILFELGLIFFSAKSGYLKEKMSAYGFWLKAANWKLWLKKRSRIQSLRKVGDKEMLRLAVGKVDFSEKSINHPLLVYVGNPLMDFYWKIAKKILIW
ncbi:MAG: glycosyltransferase family 2 protein [Patescibacteria group bacterium]